MTTRHGRLPGLASYLSTICPATDVTFRAAADMLFPLGFGTYPTIEDTIPSLRRASYRPGSAAAVVLPILLAWRPEGGRCHLPHNQETAKREGKGGCEYLLSNRRSQSSQPFL